MHTDRCAVCHQRRFRRWRPTEGDCVPSIDRGDSVERVARIDLMMEEYRRAKQRRVLRRAVKLWRRAEAQHLHLAHQARFKRVH